MARPGIMLYFDILEPIRVLPDAEKGQLFVAMLEYGQSGKEPKFQGMLAMAWGFVKPKLDKDSDEYNRTVLKRQYATYCRDCKKKGEPEPSFDVWMMTIDHQNNHMISHDITWYPTTTPSSTTNTSITTAATSNTNAAATAENELKYLQGPLGQGVVLLSDAQVSDLLDMLGLDGFEHYVKKLATFIITKNATVKNHYETIVKWWREDCNVY